MNQKGLHDCLIIGAGPAGLAMALALYGRGLSVAIAGEMPQSNPNSPDLRTAALFGGSVRMLERLGAWPWIDRHATPMTAIRIIDATGRLLRAPEQIFAAADLGLKQLGHNVPNPALTGGLVAALRAAQEPGAGSREGNGALAIDLDAKVATVTVAGDHVAAVLADGGVLCGRMAIAADGRHSITRAQAQIDVETWDHDQAAVTAHIEHALPHGGISSEIHTRTGPCTVVPLAGNRSSLVWMDRNEAARKRAALGDDPFVRELEAALGGLLGPIRAVTPRRLFPLSSMIAERFAGRRVALIGEAGHAFPPIGAQGLNLGLRDVAGLADHLAAAHAAGADIGGDAVLDAYSRDRSADIRARTYGVDAFNRSLGNPAAGLVRGAVLHATKASGSVKRLLMARGLEPVGEWPTLMRP